MNLLLISIVYQEFDIIKKHIESLFPLTNKVDIIVLENMSVNTVDTIQPYFLNLLKEKKISQYWLFDKNIAGTAFSIFFNSFINKLDTYDYITITDGDIKVYNPIELLDEILNIINNVENCFACAAELDTTNLPIKNFPQAAHWMPNAIDHGWYLECATAGHMLTFKKENLLQYLKYRNETDEIFIDGSIRSFCLRLNKKWLKTKYQKIYHLTWDLYHDINHPYTQMKIKPREDIFFNSYYSSYTKYKLENNEIILEKIK